MKTEDSVELKSVLNASPAEDEAETRVIRSIEEQDDEPGSLPDPLLLMEEAKGGFRRSASGLLRQDGTRRNLGVEEELYVLTKQLKEHASSRHLGGDAQSSESPTKEQQENQQTAAAKSSSSSSRHPSDDADLFARNAQKLVERARAVGKIMEGESYETFQQFQSFLTERRQSVWLYGRMLFLYCILPFTGLACFFYYPLGNPKGSGGPDDASVSWWLLFVFVRQPITLSLARLTEALVVDLCCIRTKVSMHLLGPFFTLMLMQSKGWPFQLTAWAAYDFAMLYGNSPFARHWLFYQDAIDIFSKKNPAGSVTQATIWKHMLACSLFIGSLISVKRVCFGIVYSNNVYRRYAKDLSAVLRKAVLIGELAGKGDKIVTPSRSMTFDAGIYANSSRDEGGESEDGEVSSDRVIDSRRNAMFGGLSPSQRRKIEDQLGEWEEPLTDERKVEYAPISAIVQFRAAVSCIDRKYPFSPGFGLADTREHCICASQKLYARLTEREPVNNILKFDALATIAVAEDGSLKEDKLRELVAVFRPTRGGEISLLDFVKSIDSVYKELRVTRASISNAQKMNAASQRIVDVMFNLILLLTALAILGINGLALIGSLFGIVVSFAFMIGGASSKYFEGLLLVLLRKPYDIGDRIAVSNVNEEVSGNGSSGWIVKDLDLFTTTVVFGTTAEEATYSNGSLASSRVINHNRSPKAVLNFVARFGIDVDEDKVSAFGKAVEQFVKDRPREWLSFVAFRLSDVQPNLGYVEYKVIMQHRESWQQIGALLNSKANVQLYAYELSKEMEMGYENPAMPIILSDRSSAHGEDHGAAASLLGR